jgi:hypothetical protein
MENSDITLVKQEEVTPLQNAILNGLRDIVDNWKKTIK